MKDNRRRDRWIMGTAIGAAAVAVAIDHTRHRLPEPVPQAEVSGERSVENDDDSAVLIIVEDETGSPCGLDAAPCSLDDSPCALEIAPCSLDESPCALDLSPCSL